MKEKFRRSPCHPRPHGKSVRVVNHQTTSRAGDFNQGHQIKDSRCRSMNFGLWPVGRLPHRSEISSDIVRTGETSEDWRGAKIIGAPRGVVACHLLDSLSNMFYTCRGRNPSIIYNGSLACRVNLQTPLFLNFTSAEKKKTALVRYILEARRSSRVGKDLSPSCDRP